MTEPTPAPPTPTVSPSLRTRLYVLGTLLGLGVAPPLVVAAAQYPHPALVVAAAAVPALSGACNALAFGYRPTLPGSSS